MKILYITQFFPPEIGAAANRAFETARLLVEDGFEVTVLTAFPNYLLTRVPPQYGRRKRALHENCEGIHTVRTYIYVSKNPHSLVLRLFAFLTFMISSLWQGLRLKRYDAILVTSPPLSLGVTAYALSTLKRIPYVFEVRDLYPESAIQLGVIRNRFIIGVTSCLARFFYRNACHVVAATGGIRDHLEAEGVERDVTVLTTGVDLSLFRPVSVDESIREKFNLRGKFNVTFIGIFGRMHALRTILDAAALLTAHGAIQFTFIGDGVQRESLMSAARQRDLTNVQFFPPQPREIVPQIINASDVCLDSRIGIGLSEGTIPVKVVEYMACGKPTVIGITGETGELINHSRAGVVVEPENPVSMVTAILSLYEDEDERERMGRDGRNYALRHFDRVEVVKELEHILLNICRRT